MPLMQTAIYIFIKNGGCNRQRRHPDSWWIREVQVQVLACRFDPGIKSPVVPQLVENDDIEILMRLRGANGQQVLTHL